MSLASTPETKQEAKPFTPLQRKLLPCAAIPYTTPRIGPVPVVRFGADLPCKVSPPG